MQVDVRALKEVLWDTLQHMQADADSPAEASNVPSELSFHRVVAAIGPSNPAGRLSDISVHLCFICLLHLANEHGLKIRDVPSLDGLAVSQV